MREAREAAGIQVELDHLIGVYCLRDRGSALRFIFAARIASGEPSAADENEIAEVGWFEPDDLPQPTTPTMSWGVRDAVAGGSRLAGVGDASTLCRNSSTASAGRFRVRYSRPSSSCAATSDGNSFSSETASAGRFVFF